ncbi:Uncharacterised protein [BD1-7 clade bacterium]|uniref:Uncharacterized protein n=1 Tax=BD1-7 clade bacterium TaxID=2029982 RepID=A0A5S9MTD9_9GAMM|nr:Uncharacterised protein [BD1-7 clade bacterium]CAA0085146.1 Uncharacterised protein [BD1-7 clade bacterium]
MLPSSKPFFLLSCAYSYCSLAILLLLCALLLFLCVLIVIVFIYFAICVPVFIFHLKTMAYNFCVVSTPRFWVAFVTFVPVVGNQW